MKTIHETPIYIKHVSKFWNEAEREEFVLWMAENPDTGDIIKGTRGLRKVRFARAGMGKSGGVRVILMLRDALGEITLLAAYTKTEHDKLSNKFLIELAKLYEE